MSVKISDTKGNQSVESMLTLEEKEQNVIIPTDRYNLCVIYIMFFGITVLLPWKTMVAATDYFQQKLDGNNELLNIFSSTLNISSNIPLIISYFLNTFYMFKLNRSLRVYLSLVAMLVGFALVIVFVPLNVTSYQSGFFSATMISAVILNVFSSIAQSTFFAILAYFPFKYILHFLFGQGMSGIVINVIKVAIIGSNYSANVSAILFFSSAFISIVFCLLFYFLFTKNKYYNYQMADALSNSSTNITKRKISLVNTFKEYRNIFKKIWMPATTVFITFSVTLLYSPGLILATKSSAFGTVWADKYYNTVVIFLLFNVADTLGKEMPKLTPWLRGDSIALMVLSISRLVFLPFFLICNKHDNSLIPNLINNDAAPIIVNFLFGFTNGYYSASAFRTAPSLVERNKVEYANTFMVFILGIGLAIGSFLSYGVNLLVKR